MPFHADGELLASSRWFRGRTTRAFGWLDPRHSYATGSCQEQVVLALEDAARSPIDRTRGWHTCPFCQGASRHASTPYTTSTGEVMELGDASLEINVDSRRRWLAPNLVLHYIADHDYVPPGEVIALIMNG
jgi:hypothetical protein